MTDLLPALRSLAAAQPLGSTTHATLEQAADEIEYLRAQRDHLQRRGTELVEENRRLRAGASPFQVMVAEFHRALDFPVRETPTVPSDDEVRLRARLIAEEAFEVLEAMLCNVALRYQREAVMAAIADADVCVEMPALANELADLHYVTSGTAVQLGIDEAPVFTAVHAANMAKAGGGKDERGKARKPAGWRKADIAAVLREQGWTGGEEPR